MSVQHSSITQALFPLLTTALLMAACSESTAPSSTENLTGATPTSQPPAEGSAPSPNTTDTSGQLSAHVTPQAFVSSSLALGMAYSNGISCSNHTLEQKLPTMTSISGGIENTSFYSYLYRWNGSGWQYWMSKGPYKSASNANGRIANWSVGGSTISGNSAYFYNLPSGYYTTVEKYFWNGTSTASYTNPWCAL